MESSTSPHKEKKKSLFDRYFENLHALRSSDAFLLKTALVSLTIFFVFFVIQKSDEQTIEIATQGGVFTEGIIGTPRFVNPVLAVTRADKDLTALIYDGLMKLGPEGVLIPNIAETVTVSEDGLIYNIILKQGVLFHDGKELTAEDVVATVLRIQDPLVGSPLRANFDGVLVEEIGEFEVNFILPEAYAPFIENLSFGIMPQHIWGEASVEEFPFSQHNTEAIGSGPYQIEKIARDTSGIPETYTLRTNETYHGGTPQMETIALRFFSTESKLVEAFNKGEIEGVAGLSEIQLAQLNLDSRNLSVVRIPQPRTFAAFFNQNKSVALRDDSVRTALNMVVDKPLLIESVLGGYGSVIDSPIPPGFGIDSETATTTVSFEEAREVLRSAGWKVNEETNIWEKEIDDIVTPLSFSISTVNNSTFEATGEFLRATWTELGAEVTVKQFELSDLTRAVIRPRDYQVLLFGTQLGRSLDFYSFWHSSQRNDPGLNIALYANITTDSILSELRRNTDIESRVETVQKFASEIENETPAVFLYAPELMYIFPTTIHNATFLGVSEPHERYASIDDWYIKTESVWSIFTQ